MRRKTNEQFQHEIYDLVGNEYTFLDSYQGTHTKIKVKHNTCGHIYMVEPASFLQGRRCSYCAGLNKKTNEQFKREVCDLVGDEYTFLDSYINAKTKLRVKHNKCGNVYKVKPDLFLHGNRCPQCAVNAKKTNEQFKNEVYDLVGNEYTFLDPYVNNHTKLRVKHNKCGKVYLVTPANFLSGSRCQQCYIETKRKTNEQFKREVYNLVGNEYTVLGSYHNADTKIKVKHNTCGGVYEVRPYSFLEGCGCPYCNSSKGELIISKILNTLNINYEAQKTFDDLKDTQSLSYDFYIPDQDILIEYQGVQHYQPVDRFGGEDHFKIQQKHDKMKLDYAKENNYNLIAVPYTEDTFSKIKKYLIKHGLKK